MSDLAEDKQSPRHVSLQRDVLAKVSATDSIDSDPLARILVIYTGGTIGMKTNRNGVYEPKSDYLVNALKKMPMFHDQEFADKYLLDDEKDFLAMPQGHFDAICSTAEHDEISRYHRGKRILYLVMEYCPLLDSSNMMMTDWAKIATDIQHHYDKFDGFVVLHGTDTMAYTASALSFMCENIGKPIILTGSQIPIFEVRSDGRDNFLSSLIVAGLYLIPEVMLCFDNKILRGNRAIKNDAGSFAAFMSPNLPPLVTLEINISVNWTAVYRSSSTEKFRVHTAMCHNVGLLRLFPGITAQTVRAFLQPPMQGVVLQTFGAGNAPDNRPDLITVFKEASNIGIIIINITQCTRGYVAATYATGKALQDAGVIGGGDMTPEAALAKLSYVLSKDTWTLDKKRRMMERNLRGEMTVVAKENITIMDFELIESVAKALSVSSTEEIKKLRDALYPNLMCSAAMTGDTQALEKLRESGGNLSSVNQDGRTALHIACREGNLHVVQYLLHHGASVHVKDHHGNTPLMDAIVGKHLSIIRLLVKTGAVITLHSMKVAMELCRAAASDEVDTIQAWKAAKVDLNVADYDKRTPLHVAVSAQCLKAVEYMIENGASWTQEDIFGNTALSFAQQKGYTDILEMFERKQKELERGENGV